LWGDEGGKIIVAILREVLTVRDLALELRCSIAHVHNVINGRAKHVCKLPAIRMERKKLVLRDTLEEWKRANEESDLDAMMRSPKTGAVGRMIEEEMHA
jgi:plasmid maintenance system antidote protein VapI